MKNKKELDTRVENTLRTKNIRALAFHEKVPITIKELLRESAELLEWNQHKDS